MRVVHEGDLRFIIPKKFSAFVAESSALIISRAAPAKCSYNSQVDLRTIINFLRKSPVASNRGS